MLAAVESGNVDAGVVYKTDAAISKKVRVVFEVPVGEGPKITYPVALVKDAPQPEAAKTISGLSDRQRGGRGFCPSRVCCFIRRRGMID